MNWSRYVFLTTARMCCSVYLAVCGDGGDRNDAIARLLSQHERPFVLVTAGALHDEDLAQIARLRGLCHLPLCETVAIDDAGALRSIAPADLLLNKFRRTVETYESGRPTANPFVFRREDRVWVLAFEGKTVYIPQRDAKGFAYIQKLLAQPNEVIDVVTLAEAVGRDVRVRAASSAGEILDSKSRLAMRERYRDAREERDEAKENNDLGRIEKLDVEIEQIVDELLRAEGLGGRTRLLDDQVERPRTNITNAINRAIKKVSDSRHARLAAHLDNAINRGRDMSYTPESPIDWVF